MDFEIEDEEEKVIEENYYAFLNVSREVSFKIKIF